MHHGRLCVALLVGLITGSVNGQVARVRVVEKVSMPTLIDSNSPAFWRDNRLYWFGSHGRPWLSSGPSQFGPWETRETDLISLEACPHWMESISQDEDGTLWGWYHCEPVGLF